MGRVLDTSPSRVRCLLGAYFKKDHFSDEDGSFFMLLRRGFLRKKSKISKKVYIVSGPSMVHTKPLNLSPFFVDKI